MPKSLIQRLGKTGAYLYKDSGITKCIECNENKPRCYGMCHNCYRKIQYALKKNWLFTVDWMGWTR